MKHLFLPLFFFFSISLIAELNQFTVLEYIPAPGQFINETKTGGFDGTQITHEAAIAYAQQRLENNDWVSLGGFGGYIVVKSSEKIMNSNGEYDFFITGNSFAGSSEPGIVYVMQDENGDELPNDTWYELRGSEFGKDSTIQNYAVTYYRPEATQMPVQWTDNQGNSGQIDYLMAYHRQDYYYPLWIEEESYTLKGTYLVPRNYDKSGNGTYWVNAEYDWGYADNYSSIDRTKNDVNNYFKISNAIDENGNSINIEYVNFIKVQTGVNSKSGWLGEISTEVVGFGIPENDKTITTNEDNINEKQFTVYPNPCINTINIITTSNETLFLYDLNGRIIISSTSQSFDISHLPSGIYIISQGSTYNKIVKQ